MSAVFLICVCERKSEVVSVYLETTIFNRFFEMGREHNLETRHLFEHIATGEILAYTSTAVLDELAPAPEPKRGQMLGLIRDYKITVLDIDVNTDELAGMYLTSGIIPERFRLDGVHIAVAALNGIDFIVSLNFHHINKLKTKLATEIIHRLRGCSNPIICTPSEVLEYEGI